MEFLGESSRPAKLLGGPDWGWYVVAGRAYELAKAKGLGNSVPTEWLTQDIRDQPSTGGIVTGTITRPWHSDGARWLKGV